jgi:phage shock protein PspC (stress-responsive transcriptional regulator)
MRKVTTINLNNNAYQVDEEGYEALRAYLARADQALASNPDRAEILQDLEQAIADRCTAVMGPHKNVVSTQEIEQILKDMGPVAGAATDGDAAPSASGPAASAAGAEYRGPRPRRLYRLREDQKLTGVCAGLAAYAGIDVTWVRVAFIVLTVFSIGFGLVAYVALVFVMPVAETAEQVAAAHGAPFSAQDLVDRVKKKSDESGAPERIRSRMNHMRNRWHSAAAPVSPPGGLARVTGGVMLPILTVMSAVWFAAMAIAALTVWWGYEAQMAVHWGSWGHWPQFPRWMVLLLLVVIYAVIALPLGAGRRAALYYANGGRPHGWADAWSGLLWLALVAIILFAAWWALPHLQEVLRYTLPGTQVVFHV